METVMLSVIAVNHNSSTLLKECFASIVSTIGDESFEFLVIDSGSRAEELHSVQNLKSENVRIIANRENIGYAKAVNEGIRNAIGDVILITNPDVHYAPGSIKNMADALFSLPHCGAVGPKIWWNKGMTFLLPFSELVTPYSILRTELMGVSGTMGKMIQKRWIKKALGYWLSEKPIMQDMLSGACVMTTRKVLDAVGGFDDSFPLYFEDTDWCLRVRKAGYHLSMVPQANVIHYYNQSAKQDRKVSQKKFESSQSLYMRKHYRTGFALLRQMLRACPEHNNASAVFEDFGTLTSPPVFAFRGSSKKVLLLSPLESLIPSAGSFFEGDFFGIPKDLWDMLGDGRYFVKALGLDRFTDCGSWSWVKQ
jgi:GT2 family glycosyltransferase